MKVTKYALVYFLEPDAIAQDLQKISEMNIRRFFIGATNLFIFSSTMTLDELYEYLEDVPEEGRLFFLTKYDDQSIKFSLPKKILEFLDSEENIDEKTYGVLMDDESDLIDGGTFEGVYDLDHNEITAKDYINTLLPEEQDSLYESILNKLPNISDWEAELLHELE